MTNPPTVDIEEGQRLLAAWHAYNEADEWEGESLPSIDAAKWAINNLPALLTAASQTQRYLEFARAWQTKAEQLEELLNEAITALDDFDPRVAEEIAANIPVLHHPEPDQVQPRALGTQDIVEIVAESHSEEPQL